MLRGSARSQERVLIFIGVTVVIIVVVAALLIVVKPFGGNPVGQISVSIDTTYVGEGVKAGTPVVIHGVQIGQVESIASLPRGGVRLVTSLQRGPVLGLTDAMKIDYRPVNYFGVTGINVIASPDGQTLRDGSQISLTPEGNFTLQALLSRLGDVSAGALTPQIIQVFDRTTQYTDALNPLIETVLIVSQELTNVQTVPTAQLLANATSVSVAFPDFTDQTFEAVDRFININRHVEPGPPYQVPTIGNVLLPSAADESQAYYENVHLKFLDIAGNGLFAAAGKLAGSHVDDLVPLITGIKSLTDTMPALVRPADIAQTLAELRSRLERLFAGNGEQRALQVRILLDSLPGVAAPLGVGAP